MTDLNPKMLDGVPVYFKIDDIPYDVIRFGGPFWIHEVPPSMENAPGQGMAATANQTGGTMTFGTDPSQPLNIFLTLWFFIRLIIATICVVVVVKQITSGIHLITAIPEGEIVDVLEDGTRIYEAPDGTVLALRPDGTVDTLSDAPPGQFEDIKTIAIVMGVILTIIAVFVLVSKVDLTKVKESVTAAKTKVTEAVQKTMKK